MPAWTRDDLDYPRQSLAGVMVHPDFARFPSYLSCWHERHHGEPIAPTELQAQLLFSPSATVADAALFRKEIGWIHTTPILIASLGHHDALNVGVKHAVLAAFVSRWWSGGKGHRLHHLKEDHDIGADELVAVMAPFRATAVLMDSDDLAAYSDLPNHLTAWRGGADSALDLSGACCWALDRDQAQGFASRSYGSSETSVLRRQFRKSEVIAYFHRERELVLGPLRAVTAPSS